jgi:hypothetical protein
MKYRGADYERAVQELKALQATMKLEGRKSGVKDRYLKEMRRVGKLFDVSDKTLYRDMRKKVPGLRKTRNDSGKVRSPLHKDHVLVHNLGSGQFPISSKTSIFSLSMFFHILFY